MKELCFLLLVGGLGIAGCADPKDPPVDPAAECEKRVAEAIQKETIKRDAAEALKNKQAALAATKSKAVQVPLQLLQAKELVWDSFPEFSEDIAAAQVNRDPGTQAISCYVKLPKKTTIANKRHVGSLLFAVVKGAVSMQKGDEKPTTIKAGGYLSIPASTVYGLTAKKESILFLNSTGPLSAPTL